MTQRIPPHNLDAERAVLGAVLIEGLEHSDAIAKAAARLVPTDFYLERHRSLFAHMLALHAGERGVDAITLAEALRAGGQLEEVGGPVTLAGLETEATVAAYLDEYIATVRDKAVLRQLIQASTGLVERAYAANGSLPALLAEAHTTLEAATERLDPEVARQSEARVPPFVSIAEVMERTHLELRFGSVDLVPSHIAYLNDCFSGGFKRKELVIFGAAAGLGKSAFITEWARHAARLGHRVGVITIEMANEEFGERLLVQAGPISASAMRGGTLDWVDWQTVDRVVPELAGLPIEFSDEVTHVQQIGRMLRRRRERRQPPFRALFVDYLQLLDAPRAQARYQEVSLIAKLLKRYAKTYDLTLVAVSSFTPGPPERSKKRARPTMNNLRESKDLSFAADGVVLMWRPKEDSTDRELIIDKGRGGRTGATRLAFTGQYLTFQEIP